MILGCVISARLSVLSTEVCVRVPEQLVALSFDMSGGMFMQPVAWQPQPNRLVDVVTNVCVHVCVCLQTGVTAALHGAQQVCAALPLLTTYCLICQ